MIEFISLLILFCGLAIASYYDLKTTEIPDRLAYALLALGIILFFSYHFTMKNWEVFKTSLISSLILLAIGFGMYFFGHWGLGDSFLLASSGFLFFSNPTNKVFINPQIDYLFNVFLVGIFYVLFYSFLVFLRNEKFPKIFSEEIKKQAKWILVFLAFLIVFFSVLSFITFKKVFSIQSAFSILIAFLLTILWIYLKSGEKLFVKKIKIEELKVGDVLLESKRWDGIDKKTLEKIRKSGKKYVYIKTGIAFAPVFLLALIFTLLFGNLYLSFLKMILFLM